MQRVRFHLIQLVNWLLVIFFLASTTLFSQAKSLTHQAPDDFLTCWKEGAVDLSLPGAVGIGRGTIPDTPRRWKHTQYLPLGRSVPDNAASSSVIGEEDDGWQGFRQTPAWNDLYRISPNPEGKGSQITLQRDGIWQKVGALPNCRLEDLEWFDGSLYLLMRPPQAPPTSNHIYRLKVTPNGEVGLPELATLAPAGMILEKLTVSQGIMLAVGRAAGEKEFRLFHLRGLEHHTPGWSDCGPVRIFSQEKWDLACIGNRLILFSPLLRDVRHCIIPRPGDFTTWETDRIPQGVWEDCFSQWLTSLGETSESSAQLVHEFHLNQPQAIQGIRVRTIDGFQPGLRWRLAKSPHEGYSDWSASLSKEYIPVNEVGQVLQYQLLQNQTPVRLKEVSVLISPSTKDDDEQSAYQVAIANLPLAGENRGGDTDNRPGNGFERREDQPNAQENKNEGESKRDQATVKNCLPVQEGKTGLNLGIIGSSPNGKPTQDETDENQRDKMESPGDRQGAAEDQENDDAGFDPIAPTEQSIPSQSPSQEGMAQGTFPLFQDGKKDSRESLSSPSFLTKAPFAQASENLDTKRNQGSGEALSTLTASQGSGSLPSEDGSQERDTPSTVQGSQGNESEQRTETIGGAPANTVSDNHPTKDGQVVKVPVNEGEGLQESSFPMWQNAKHSPPGKKQESTVPSGLSGIQQGLDITRGYYPYLLLLLLWLLVALIKGLRPSKEGMTQRIASLQGRHDAKDCAPPFYQSRPAPQGFEFTQKERVAVENRLASQSVSGESGQPRGSQPPQTGFLPTVLKGNGVEFRVAEPLPQPMAPATAFYHRGRIYVVDPHGTICHAKLKADGSLSAWGVRMGHLPGKGKGVIAMVADFLVCAVGNRIYTARVSEEQLGEWKLAGILPEVRALGSLAACGSQLFMVEATPLGNSLPIRSVEVNESGQVVNLHPHPPIPSAVPEGTLMVAGQTLHWLSGTGPSYSADLHHPRAYESWRKVPPLPWGGGGRGNPIRTTTRQATAPSQITYWNQSLWILVGIPEQKVSQLFQGKCAPTGELLHWEPTSLTIPETVSGRAGIYAGGRFLFFGGFRDQASLFRRDYAAKHTPSSEVAWCTV
jgi:hypothetical protein